MVRFFNLTYKPFGQDSASAIAFKKVVKGDKRYLYGDKR
jgi:hypothetical protein